MAVVVPQERRRHHALFEHLQLQLARLIRDAQARGGFLAAEDVAAKYRVSRAWVHRLVQRRRETGEITTRLWADVPALADSARGWLAHLPAEVAQKIAFRNGERLFGPK